MMTANVQPLMFAESSDLEVPSSRAAVNQKQSAELALVRRVQAGDLNSFYELVRPYERTVFVAARGLVKNDADAEDVAQEAVLKAFKGISHFSGEAKFSTWLIQITINEAKMKLRKDRRHLYDSIEEGQQGEDNDYVPRDFADWREIPSEALQRKEIRDAVNEALNSLPEKYRTVLVLRDVQQLSIAETANVLGISETNVKTRLLRARLQLRDALAPGFDESWILDRDCSTLKAL